MGRNRGKEGKKQKAGRKKETGSKLLPNGQCGILDKVTELFGSLEKDSRLPAPPPTFCPVAPSLDCIC